MIPQYEYSDRCTLDKADLLERLGTAAFIASNSPFHRDLTLIQFTTIVIQAINQRRILFLYGKCGELLGYTIIAMLSSDVENRIKRDCSYRTLHVSDWNEGPSLWVFDIAFRERPGLSNLLRFRRLFTHNQTTIAYLRKKNNNIEFRELKFKFSKSHRIRCHESLLPSIQNTQTMQSIGLICLITANRSEKAMRSLDEALGRLLLSNEVHTFHFFLKNDVAVAAIVVIETILADSSISAHISGLYLNHQVGRDFFYFLRSQGIPRYMQITYHYRHNSKTRTVVMVWEESSNRWRKKTRGDSF